MSDILIEVAFILALVLGNAVFAMSEIAMVSSRRPRLRHRADKGDKGAQAALELVDDPDQFLSTIQIGITMVGILTGAFGGATVSKQLAEFLGQIPRLAPYAQGLSLMAVVLVIGYFSLVLGELVPKRLGLNAPERIAARVAVPMRFVSRLAAPMVRLLSGSTNLVLRLLGARASEEPSLSREEIKHVLAEGVQSGALKHRAHKILERVVRLGDRRIQAVMVPRTEMTYLMIDDSPERLREKVAASTHDRLPVCRDHADNVLGFVHLKDLCFREPGQPFDWSSVLRKPVFVPESMAALNVLEVFKRTGTHEALVVNEFGGVEGLVTSNTILEAVVGDIGLSGTTLDPPVVRREDGSWLLDGLLPIDEAASILELDPADTAGEYRTLGGFVVHCLGKIPISGDRFELKGRRFEVVDMDGKRVDKVLVSSR